jgi:hypothetical protein
MYKITNIFSLNLISAHKNSLSSLHILLIIKSPEILRGFCKTTVTLKLPRSNITKTIKIQFGLKSFINQEINRMVIWWITKRKPRIFPGP